MIKDFECIIIESIVNQSNVVFSRVSFTNQTFIIRCCKSFFLNCI